MNIEGENVLDIAAAWVAEGRRAALATVVSTWRSSPRPTGSQMIVDALPMNATGKVTKFVLREQAAEVAP